MFDSLAKSTLKNKFCIEFCPRNLQATLKSLPAITAQTKNKTQDQENPTTTISQQPDMIAKQSKH
jgi:hypothetical protein